MTPLRNMDIMTSTRLCSPGLIYRAVNTERLRLWTGSLKVDIPVRESGQRLSEAGLTAGVINVVLGSVCKFASSLSACVCVRVGRFQPVLARHGTAAAATE